jgi:hypothetical protein
MPPHWRSSASPPVRVPATGRTLGRGSGAARGHGGLKERPGQRVKVVRCSLSAAQLEPVTCTYTLLMLPPQVTQWLLPYA